MKGTNALLIIILVALCGSMYMSYTNYQQMQVLRQENATLWVKLDSVQQIVNKKPVQQKAAPAPAPAQENSIGNAFLDFLIQIQEEIATEDAASRSKQKITVSSKYRLEDRYVSYKVSEPEFLGDQIGEVVLDILVDRDGDVKSAKLQSSTGITNEDVIEACKKAALKTRFNHNFDLPRDSKQSGTISYIFSTK